MSTSKSSQLRPYSVSKFITIGLLFILLGTIPSKGFALKVLDTLPTVYIAYLIPSNRVPQDSAVQILQETVLLAQSWYREQMIQNCFAAKSFEFEKEESSSLPKVHIVQLDSSDSYFRQNIVDYTQEAARSKGIPVGVQRGQIWILFNECHIQLADGSVQGGIAVGGYPHDSSDDAGFTLVGSNAIPWIGKLSIEKEYDGQIIPELGPHPLVFDKSAPGFEGRTFSSVASSVLGAIFHELGHAFGLYHDLRNDDNFYGNLMGNGLRGIRGNLYPQQFPSNYTRLSYSSALRLNHCPYFGITYQRNQNSEITILTTGAVKPENGKISLHFTAYDQDKIAGIYLVEGGEYKANLTVNSDFIDTLLDFTQYRENEVNVLDLWLVDIYGNTHVKNFEIEVLSSANRAPTVFLSVSQFGEDLILNAERSYDEDGIKAYYWDLQSDGSIDTFTTNPILSLKEYQECNLVSVSVEDTEGAAATSSIVSIYTPFTISENSQSAILCEGDTAKLMVFTSGDDENLFFQWFKNDTLLLNENGKALILNEVEADESGQYICGVKHPSGVYLKSHFELSIYKQVKYESNIPDTILIDDSPLSLTATPSGGDFIGNGIQSSLFHPSIAGEGVHIIEYQYTDGICNTIYLDTIVVERKLTSTLSIVEKVNINIFPNPNEGTFQILLNRPLEIENLKILNSFGHVVESHHNLLDTNTIEIKVQCLPGAYLLVLNSSLENTVTPFFVLE